MKNIIFGILIICLLIGIPLIIMDQLSTEKGIFNIPSGYEKIEIDLNEARTNEIVFSKAIENPELVEFCIQSDSEVENTLKIASDSRILGKGTSEISLSIGEVIKNSAISSSLLLKGGKYTITLSNKKLKGKIMIGYREKVMKASEFERLEKIDQGDLDNPPEGYKKVYCTELPGLSYNDNTIYTLTLDRTKKVGLCIYMNSKQGNVSVDFEGENSNYMGLVYTKYNSICDQMEQTLGRGTYDVKLNCKNADGQLYVFIKE